MPSYGFPYIYGREKFCVAGILYQVGNLESYRVNSLVKEGVADSKIMTDGKALYHGTADKNKRQRLPKEQFEDVYELFLKPERRFENQTPDHPGNGREFHFVKDNEDGRNMYSIFRLKSKASRLRLVTLGVIEDSYAGERWKKLVTIGRELHPLHPRRLRARAMLLFRSSTATNCKYSAASQGKQGFSPHPWGRGK